LASVDYNSKLTQDAVSAGTLNIAKALSVYDDVLEIRDSDNSVHSLVGRWERGSTSTVALCVADPNNSGIFDPGRLLKITTTTNTAGQVELRLLYRDDDGRMLDPISCTPEGEGISFLKEGQAEAQPHPWLSIVDLVPRYFLAQDLGTRDWSRRTPLAIGNESGFIRSRPDQYERDWREEGRSKASRISTWSTGN
jgi:hypothetical protein